MAARLRRGCGRAKTRRQGDVDAHKISALALVTALLIGAQTEEALADPATEDVHCYIVFAQLSLSPNDALKMAGVLGSVYYVGKLDGRSPGLDIESLILAEYPKMTTNVYPADIARCSDEMQKRGAEITKMGEDLKDKAAALQQQQPNQNTSTSK